MQPYQYKIHIVHKVKLNSVIHIQFCNTMLDILNDDQIVSKGLLYDETYFCAHHKAEFSLLE